MCKPRHHITMHSITPCHNNVWQDNKGLRIVPIIVVDMNKWCLRFEVINYSTLVLFLNACSFCDEMAGTAEWFVTPPCQHCRNSVAHPTLFYCCRCRRSQLPASVELSSPIVAETVHRTRAGAELRRTSGRRKWYMNCLWHWCFHERGTVAA